MSLLSKMKEIEIQIYYQGKRNGVWDYAFMKDGVYYVGSCGTTWKSAKDKINAQEKEALRNHALHTT